MAIASPVWGILGDRFGRKPMLIRSMLGGGITVGLIFLAQTPLHPASRAGRDQRHGGGGDSPRGRRDAAA